jgi:hypothetical protein
MAPITFVEDDGLETSSFEDPGEQCVIKQRVRTSDAPGLRAINDPNRTQLVNCISLQMVYVWAWVVINQGNILAVVSAILDIAIIFFGARKLLTYIRSIRRKS